MKPLLTQIYILLNKSFGNRDWWPADTRDEVIIGAILAQNVTWRNVQKAFDNLKTNNIYTLKDINDLNIIELATLLKPTRFYNQKANRLKTFTSWLYTSYDGSLDAMFSNTLGELRNQLLNIKGIGEETVDSILLYAGEKSIFVIDAYTRRIFSRLGITDERWSYAVHQLFFHDHLEHDLYLFNDYHAQIVHLGHYYCTKTSPRCNICPLIGLCSHANNTPAQIESINH